MIQQKIVRHAVDRVNYILALTSKYDKKKEEVQAEFSNVGKNWKNYFKELERETTSNKSRVARHIIVPVPLKARDNPLQQKDFAQKYINNLFNSMGLNPPPLYVCAVHQVPSKRSESGVQAHAHIIFSERPLLKEPITKHIKTRYYDQNNRECKKANSVKCIKAHDRVEYFGDKYKIPGNDKKELFSSKEFCKKCDEVWRETTLETKLMDRTELRFFGLDGKKPQSLKQKHLGEVDRVLNFPKTQKSYFQRQLHLDKVKTEFRGFYNKSIKRKSGEPPITAPSSSSIWAQVNREFTEQRQKELRKELEEGEISLEQYKELEKSLWDD